MTSIAPLLLLVHLAYAESPVVDGAAAAPPDDAAVADNGAAGPGTKRGRDDRRGTGGRRGPPPPPPGERPPQDGEPPEGPSADPRGGHPPPGLRPFAMLQLWGTVYDMDTDPQADAAGIGDPENDPGVSVRRLRLGFRGREKGIRYDLTVGWTSPYDGLDLNNGRLDVIDASIGYERGGFGVVAGRMLLPFSRDNLMSSAELTFTERGFGAQYVVPGRVLGVAGYAEKAGGRVTAGVYNSGAGDLFGDDNVGKTLVGRAEWATGGDAYSLWRPNAKGVTFGVGGGGFWTDDVATTTTAVGGDALIRVGGLGVLADVAWSRIAPGDSTVDAPGVLAPTTRLAVTGEVSYGIGDFQPAARWTHLVDDAFGSNGQGLLGVIWHGAYDDDGRDRVRVGAGYVLRVEDEAYANDSVRIWAQLRP